MSKSPISDKKLWLAEVILIMLALVAMRRGNPHEYYIFLRWAACPLFAWLAWKAFKNYSNIALAVSAGLLAAIYNPAIRVVMDRERWELVNMAMIAVAIWSALVGIKFTPSPKTND